MPTCRLADISVAAVITSALKRPIFSPPVDGVGSVNGLRSTDLEHEIRDLGIVLDAAPLGRGASPQRPVQRKRSRDVPHCRRLCSLYWAAHGSIEVGTPPRSEALRLDTCEMPVCYGPDRARTRVLVEPVITLRLVPIGSGNLVDLR